MSQFGEWELTSGQAIGGGHFGQIYEVARNAPGTKVRQYGALKLVSRASNESMRISIENEIATYASLQSPFIPTFYEAGWDENHGPWFIVALIKGKSLSEILETGKTLKRKEWFELADNLFSALITVHAAGLTHLDIWKPNVMKIDSGQWMLIDFGLTIKEFAEPLASNWGWGAPEQYRPGLVPTAAADIFALGNALYCALTNKNPYDAYHPMFYSDAVQQFAPNLSEIDSDIREFLSPMFSMKPEQRPSAVELKQDLKVLMGLESAPPVQGQTLIAWQQLHDLVSKHLDAGTDFRISLLQPPGIRLHIDIIQDGQFCRVGFNSEKTLGRVLPVSGRERLRQIGFSIDASGNYFTRVPRTSDEISALVVELVKSGVQLSLAELSYEIS